MGDARVVPVKGLVAVNEGDGKVSFNLTNHGFVEGAKFVITDTANYNGEHTLLAESTPHKVVINATFTAETLGADAAFSQDPDFANLDEMVTGGTELIPEIKMSGLVNMMSRDVMSGEAQKMFGSQDPATPSELRYVLESQKNHGGLPSYRILGMKPGSLWTTSFNNLSIYELEGSKRKKSEQKEEVSGYADWNYGEYDNVVEDVDKMVVFENIRFLRKHSTQMK